MARTVDSVHPIIPLALLEALQNLDNPPAEEWGELIDQMMAKRLGVSRTVAAQASRYEQRLRSGSVPVEEAAALFTLLGRRPDHDLLFAEAGRRAARRAVRLLYPRSRRLAALRPAGLGRLFGLRLARGIARRVFDAGLALDGPTPTAVVRQPLSVRGGDGGQGCLFYGAAFAETLRLLIGYEGAMRHTECRARRSAACRWRAALPTELAQ